jgi:hypothetical protein
MAMEVEARWLFLTMIIVADEARTGRVDMPLAALASRAGLSVESARRALEELKKPDPSSKCQLAEGRRVVPLPRPAGFEERGWTLPSWPEHRARMKSTKRKEQVRQAQATFRDRKRNQSPSSLIKGELPSALPLKGELPYKGKLSRNNQSEPSAGAAEPFDLGASGSAREHESTGEPEHRNPALMVSTGDRPEPNPGAGAPSAASRSAPASAYKPPSPEALAAHQEQLRDQARSLGARPSAAAAPGDAGFDPSEAA